MPNAGKPLVQEGAERTLVLAVEKDAPGRLCRLTAAPWRAWTRRYWTSSHVAGRARRPRATWAPVAIRIVAGPEARLAAAAQRAAVYRVIGIPLELDRRPSRVSTMTPQPAAHSRQVVA